MVSGWIISVNWEAIYEIRLKNAYLEGDIHFRTSPIRNVDFNLDGESN